MKGSEGVCGKQTFDHVVAFIDILGSSHILKSDDEKAISDYLLGIKGLYFLSQEHVTDGIKMFSDNILIYSEGSTEDDVHSIVSSVARIQWSVMKEFNLFIRGGIVIGRLDKIPEESTDYIIGKAIVQAHEMESKTAIYPRVVVSQDIADMCRGPDSLIKTDWDIPFIDYLQLSINEGFVSEDLKTYRQSLLAHLDMNNHLAGCEIGEWDRIRSKDVWALSYYNDFCRMNDCEDLIIKFNECYNASDKRIVVNIDNENGGE